MCRIQPPRKKVLAAMVWQEAQPSCLLPLKHWNAVVSFKMMFNRGKKRHLIVSRIEKYHILYANIHTNAHKHYRAERERERDDFATATAKSKSSFAIVVFALEIFFYRMLSLLCHCFSLARLLSFREHFCESVIRRKNQTKETEKKQSA